MKIYLVHPISGMTADEVFDYYTKTSKELTDQGYDVLTPMFGKENLRCEKEFRASGYKSPCTTNHAIFNRDKWMVMQADIIYANFLNAKQVSIGSMMELAWASDHGKHVIVSMQDENPHAHAFVYEASNIVYNNHEDVIEYLTKIIKKRM